VYEALSIGKRPQLQLARWYGLQRWPYRAILGSQDCAGDYVIRKRMALFHEYKCSAPILANFLFKAHMLAYSHYTSEQMLLYGDITQEWDEGDSNHLERTAFMQCVKHCSVASPRHSPQLSPKTSPRHHHSPKTSPRISPQSSRRRSAPAVLKACSAIEDDSLTEMPKVPGFVFLPATGADHEEEYVDLGDDLARVFEDIDAQAAASGSLSSSTDSDDWTAFQLALGIVPESDF
jgi:hypothetical protein